MNPVEPVGPRPTASAIDGAHQGTLINHQGFGPGLASPRSNPLADILSDNDRLRGGAAEPLSAVFERVAAAGRRVAATIEAGVSLVPYASP